MVRNCWESLVDDVADVPTAEVSAHDVRLVLPGVKEPAGFGGEFGLVPGPVGVGQAALDLGADELVWVQLGWSPVQTMT